ncbi:carbon-nitrogen hydrolase family protein [Catelliglobosispora koreensis]|uniref:carbon-nitrogen hydrolase family protein n=1 Tax=Catelliglobosispora koreensis TaxID=129052 RepID=UPI00037C0180|nr:carbon-nitrogen hydrolase family protein [Catelliglobosispora koreensis]
MAAPTLTVAVVQTAPRFGDVLANVHSGVTAIGAAGAPLVVFPEMSLVGYDLDCLSDPDSWVSANDPRLDPLRQAAIDAGVTAVIGAAYRDEDGKPLLAALVLGPDGSLDVHGKQNLHGRERALFQPGGPSRLLTIDGWRIALAICYDAGVPVHAQTVAAMGAELYAGSALYSVEEARRIDLHFASRAMDHRMYAAVANFAGTGPGWVSCGGSGFWHPDGRRLRQAATEPAIVVMELSRDELEALRVKDAQAGYPRGITSSGTAS